MKSTSIAVIATLALAFIQRTAVRLCAKFSDSFSFAEAVCLSQMVCVVLTKAAYTVRASQRERLQTEVRSGDLCVCAG